MYLPLNILARPLRAPTLTFGTSTQNLNKIDWRLWKTSSLPCFLNCHLNYIITARVMWLKPMNDVVWHCNKKIFKIINSWLISHLWKSVKTQHFSPIPCKSLNQANLCRSLSLSPFVAFVHSENTIIAKEFLFQYKAKKPTNNKKTHKILHLANTDCLLLLPRCRTQALIYTHSKQNQKTQYLLHVMRHFCSFFAVELCLFGSKRAEFGRGMTSTLFSEQKRTVTR